MDERQEIRRLEVESENASLRGAAQGLGELCEKYKAENAKLRELIVKMRYGATWTREAREYIEAKMRELGIEVG